MFEMNFSKSSIEFHIFKKRSGCQMLILSYKQTDSAGGSSLGCGACLSGKGTYIQWPRSWANTEVLRDITYLELVPIPLSILFWGYQLKNKKVIFYTDNDALVSVLNNESSKSDRVMSLLRDIVYWSLLFNFQLKSKYSFSAKILYVMQVKRFRLLAPSADTYS